MRAEVNARKKNSCRHNITCTNSISSRNNTKLGSSGSKVRAEVNSRKKIISRRNNNARRNSTSGRNNIKLGSTGSSLRAEVNARQKSAPPEPKSGCDVIKPETLLELVPLHLLIGGDDRK